MTAVLQQGVRVPLAAGAEKVSSHQAARLHVWFDTQWQWQHE